MLSLFIIYVHRSILIFWLYTYSFVNALLNIRYRSTTTSLTRDSPRVVTRNYSTVIISMGHDTTIPQLIAALRRVFLLYCHSICSMDPSLDQRNLRIFHTNGDSYIGSPLLITPKATGK